MTCSEFLTHLDDLIDNTISVPMRAELEEHLHGCEHCVVTLSTTRKTIEIYRKHAIYELPNDLRDRLQKAILAKCRKC